MADTIFVSGMYLNKVSDNAPAYIITNQDIHVDTMIKWLQDNRGLANERGYIKITGKEGQSGKRYFAVGAWKPTKTEPPVAEQQVPSGQGYTGQIDTGEAPNKADIPF